VHLGTWGESEGLSCAEFGDAILHSFRQHLAACECFPRRGKLGGVRAGAGARLFLDYLRQAGVTPTPNDQNGATGDPELLQSFGRWMLQHRGVMPSTLETYGRILKGFLDALGEDPAQFGASGLREFVLDQAARYSRHQAKLVVTAVRMFVRYLIAEGLCVSGLDRAIPTIAEWRLSVLPRYLPACDVTRIIDSCDTSKPAGVRDRAVLLLLARLGLRAGEVAALRFDDIDWQAASLSVAGKGRRESRLPLPQDVGDAIIDYLERGRPPLDDGRVFLRVIAPQGPLKRYAISDIVARAIRRAGVAAPSQGAHLLRHSAATAMLRQGSSLDAVASVLRHRSLDITAHYAKVHVELLREIAQPWPEAIPC